jgi:hypothetical protein
MLGRNKQRSFHEGAESFRIIYYFHGTAAQNVRWPHQHRIADALGACRAFSTSLAVSLSG